MKSNGEEKRIPIYHYLQIYIYPTLKEKDSTILRTTFGSSNRVEASNSGFSAHFGMSWSSKLLTSTETPINEKVEWGINHTQKMINLYQDPNPLHGKKMKILCILNSS